MASPDAFWASSTRVCFVDQEFIATLEGTLVRVTPQLDTLEFVLAAFRTLQMRVEGVSPPSVHSALADRRDATTSYFRRFLGVTPSRNVLHYATLTLVNVAKQLPVEASPFPLGLKNSATTYSQLSNHILLVDGFELHSAPREGYPT